MYLVLLDSTKILFTDRCRWQNFRPRLLHLVNNCVKSIYNMQKTRTKVLPSATVGDWYFSMYLDKSSMYFNPILSDLQGMNLEKMAIVLC